MIWFTLGLIVSALNMRSIVRFVNTLEPGMEKIQLRLLLSYLLRYVLSGGLLYLAIHYGLREALFVFAGLWSYRWMYLLRQRLLTGITKHTTA